MMSVRCGHCHELLPTACLSQPLPLVLVACRLLFHAPVPCVTSLALPPALLHPTCAPTPLWCTSLPPPPPLSCFLHPSQAFRTATREDAEEVAAAAEEKAREAFKQQTLAEAEQRINDARTQMEAMVREAEERARRAEVRVSPRQGRVCVDYHIRTLPYHTRRFPPAFRPCSLSRKPQLLPLRSACEPRRLAFGLIWSVWW